MNYRDPNTLYRTGETVGTLESAIEAGKDILLCGSLDPEAMRSLGLRQVIVLDACNRFVQAGDVDEEGEWRIRVSPRDSGKDNAALGIAAFAASRSNNFLFSLVSNPSALDRFRAFAARHLPENSRDVPSFADEFRDLILKATQQPYVSRSIRDAIATGNNYQTLALGNTLRQGGRQSRERFLFQIDFRGKTVLDIGANTGENSRIARKLGARLVDGYEYDPYFVEIGRAAHALSGMTRVSLFQGDCTRPELYRRMRYDIVLALAVWVYLAEVIGEIAGITDVLVLETHTLDHGIEAYYQPIGKHFPCAVSLGYSDLREDPHQSRMFLVFGKSQAAVDSLLSRKFLRVEPYYVNEFLEEHHNLSKREIQRLCRALYEKHVGKSAYSDPDLQYGSRAYSELFLAGLHQFWNNEGKVEGLVDEENLYVQFLKKSIQRNQIDPNLRILLENPSWMIRKVSNKYEDAFNILNGLVDRVAPIEVGADAGGSLAFTTSTGEALTATDIDGHHRFFLCQLAGVPEVHYNLSGEDSGGRVPELFDREVEANYTLDIP